MTALQAPVCRAWSEEASLSREQLLGIYWTFTGLHVIPQCRNGSSQSLTCKKDDTWPLTRSLPLGLPRPLWANGPVLKGGNPEISRLSRGCLRTGLELVCRNRC